MFISAASWNNFNTFLGMMTIVSSIIEHILYLKDMPTRIIYINNIVLTIEK